MFSCYSIYSTLSTDIVGGWMQVRLRECQSVRQKSAQVCARHRLDLLCCRTALSGALWSISAHAALCVSFGTTVTIDKQPAAHFHTTSTTVAVPTPKSARWALPHNPPSPHLSFASVPTCNFHTRSGSCPSFAESFPR